MIYIHIFYFLNCFLIFFSYLLIRGVQKSQHGLGLVHWTQLCSEYPTRWSRRPSSILYLSSSNPLLYYTHVLPVVYSTWLYWFSHLCIHRHRPLKTSISFVIFANVCQRIMAAVWQHTVHTTMCRTFPYEIPMCSCCCVPNFSKYSYKSCFAKRCFPQSVTALFYTYNALSKSIQISPLLTYTSPITPLLSSSDINSLIWLIHQHVWCMIHSTNQGRIVANGLHHQQLQMFACITLHPSIVIIWDYPDNRL